MSKKIKNSLLSIQLVFLATTLGLAYYVTDYAPKKQNSENQIIYVAKEEIAPNVLITNQLLNDKFEEKVMTKKDVLPSYIQSFNSDQKLYTKNTILKGEPLMNTRLKDSKEVEGRFEIKLEPNYIGKLNQNDYVQVFVQIVNSKSGESTIHTLFPKKQIKLVKASNEHIDSVDEVYVNVSEDELRDYYMAKQKGKIILGKITNPDLDMSDVEVLDFESEEFKEAIILEDTTNTNIETINPENQQVAEHTIVQDETLESIATQYNTTLDILKEINPELVNEIISEGQVVYVPIN